MPREVIHADIPARFVEHHQRWWCPTSTSRSYRHRTLVMNGVPTECDRASWARACWGPDRPAGGRSAAWPTMPRVFGPVMARHLRHGNGRWRRLGAAGGGTELPVRAGGRWQRCRGQHHGGSIQSGSFAVLFSARYTGSATAMRMQRVDIAAGIDARPARRIDGLDARQYVPEVFRQHHLRTSRRRFLWRGHGGCDQHG